MKRSREMFILLTMLLSFLLAKLHMDALRDLPTEGHVKKALKGLPKGKDGLFKTYDQAMERIKAQSPENRELAKRILMWIVHAERPLHVTEITVALAVEAGASELDEDFLPHRNDLDSLCGGPVTVDENTQTVSGTIVSLEAQKVVFTLQYNMPVPLSFPYGTLVLLDSTLAQKMVLWSLTHDESFFCGGTEFEP